MKHARAILWAQWRTLRNFYPRGGAVWSAVVQFAWYGGWTLAAAAVARVMASPQSVGLIETALPGGLVLVFLYWQVVPLLMAATGASLDLRKLQVYPIPVRQLFAIEVMLRVTGAVEMVLLLAGAAVGLTLNPHYSVLNALAVLPYLLFNLFLAVGLRDLAARLLAHRRVREVVILVVVICVALPQFFLARGSEFKGLRRFLAVTTSRSWPWTATSNLMQGTALGWSLLSITAWCVLAGAFGLWQFSRTLSFDAQVAGARVRPAGRTGPVERFFRLPSVLFRDPLGALVEKEIRFLARSPRFRLVFMMGFTFGLVVWLPLAFGRHGAAQSFVGRNFLTAVSVYSVLLLSEVCFWNSFGFDRSAAQFYFLAPVPFSRVLMGKNLSATLFIVLEFVAVTTVSASLGMPIDPLKLGEAFAVAAVISLFLLGAGNLMSVHQPRGVNPESSFRSSAAGRVQSLLFVVYPIAFAPTALAYLARWAFDSELAFFAVLAFDAVAGVVVYRVATQSAVQSAERLKETFLAALAAGDGPIAG
jgi:ABC-2 type transport system permease protein